jgi:hypothetical protein
MIKIPEPREQNSQEELANLGMGILDEPATETSDQPFWVQNSRQLLKVQLPGSSQ